MPASRNPSAGVPVLVRRSNAVQFLGMGPLSGDGTPSVALSRSAGYDLVAVMTLLLLYMVRITIVPSSPVERCDLRGRQKGHGL